MRHHKHPHERIVFCDFDGTITRKETLVAMLNELVPETLMEYGHKIAQKKISLKEGVRRVVESIPSSQYERAVDFIRTQEIRPGFLELLQFLKNEGIPFVVISGGLMDSVQTRLEEYTDYIHGIFAPKIDDTGEYVKIISEFEGDGELVSKVRVMSLFDFKESVAIGDGATDHKMALSASTVFARKRLAKFLEQEGKPYLPWHDFFDVKQTLINRWRL